MEKRDINMSESKPIERNFKDIRNVRQQNNNKIVYNSVKTNNMKMFHENINCKEYKRLLNDLEFTENEFIKKCIEDDKFCIAISRLISKNSSRQGSKDEKEQLITCNITSQKYGLTITNLKATEFRPTKNGIIVSKREMKKKSIPKDMCLKSFDGKITGKINGYITAKVSYGSGGHQDNVFEEMDVIAEWWKTYKSDNEDILIVLIDTDLTQKLKILKNKYKNVKNVMIYNHIEFQLYIINTYG